jgi:hypothetical protein
MSRETFFSCRSLSRSISYWLHCPCMYIPVHIIFLAHCIHLERADAMGRHSKSFSVSPLLQQPHRLCSWAPCRASIVSCIFPCDTNSCIPINVAMLMQWFRSRFPEKGRPATDHICTILLEMSTFLWHFDSTCWACSLLAKPFIDVCIAKWVTSNVNNASDIDLCCFSNNL